MCLLLNGPDERKHRRYGADGNFGAFGGYERSCAVLVVLDHAVGRNIQSKRLQDLLCNPCMLNAAVDQQNIRPLGKARILLNIMRETAQENLVHGRIIILIGQTLDAEALIGGFEWPAVLKDDHGRDNVRSGQIGNIIGLHPVRNIRQMEHIGQRAERSGAALCFGCNALGLFARIFMGKFDQTHIIAALRHADKDLFVQFLLQKSREQFRILQFKRRKDDLWRCAARKIELLDKGGDSFLRVVRRR